MPLAVTVNHPTAQDFSLGNLEEAAEAELTAQATLIMKVAAVSLAQAEVLAVAEMVTTER